MPVLLLMSVSEHARCCCTGNVHCLGCGKAFKEAITLAQHLKDKHQGRNADTTTSARTGPTLGDIMAQAQAKRAAAAAAAAAKPSVAERHQKQYSAFTPGDSRGMREYLKVCCLTARPVCPSCICLSKAMNEKRTARHASMT